MMAPSLAAIAGCVALGLLLCGGTIGWCTWQLLSRLRADLSRWELWP